MKTHFILLIISFSLLSGIALMDYQNTLNQTQEDKEDQPRERPTNQPRPQTNTNMSANIYSLQDIELNKEKYLLDF